MALVAALASGSLFGTCDTRLKEAFVGGVKVYLYTMLDPNNLVDFLAAESDGDAGDSVEE